MLVDIPPQARAPGKAVRPNVRKEDFIWSSSPASTLETERQASRFSMISSETKTIYYRIEPAQE
jgi:hypothetical protein